MTDGDRRNGPGRRNDDITLAELDEVLSSRDARVRIIFREEVATALADGLGHAIRREVRSAMDAHEEEMQPRVTEHDRMVRLLWGDEQGLDVGAVATLREHREMVARIKTISVAIKIAVPLIGVDVLARLLPLTDFFGG